MVSKKLTLKLNNETCAKHLDCYIEDMCFSIYIGKTITNSYSSGNIKTMEDLKIIVQHIRGYLISYILVTCKLKEIIEFIKRNETIEFTEPLNSEIISFLKETTQIVSFRNHYIAHPVKKDHKTYEEYLMPISETKEYLKTFFSMSEDEYNDGNKTLIKRIGEFNEKLEQYKEFINRLKEQLLN